jgi:hypothetical protein
MNGTQVFMFHLCRLPFYIISLPSMPIRHHILALDKYESKFNPTLFRTGARPICSTHVGLYKQQDTSSFTFFPIYFAPPCALGHWQVASRRRRLVVQVPAAPPPTISAPFCCAMYELVDGAATARSITTVDHYCSKPRQMVSIRYLSDYRRSMST